MNFASTVYGKRRHTDKNAVDTLRQKLFCFQNGNDSFKSNLLTLLPKTHAKYVTDYV